MPTTNSQFTTKLKSIRAAWIRYTGLDWATYKLVLKSVIAPTIGLALYQSSSFAAVFKDYGYLVAVGAIICPPFSPRAQFIKEFILNTSFSAIAAGVTALAFFCIVKARDSVDATYDSSASAVAGVWLAFMTFIIGSFITHIDYIYPGSACLVFSTFGLVPAAQMKTLDEAWAFYWRLTASMYLGMFLSAAVSLLIFPTTSRDNFRRVAYNCEGALKKALDGVDNILCKMAESDDFDDFQFSPRTSESRLRPAHHDGTSESAQAAKALAGLYAALDSNLPAAKEEMVISKLTPDHLQSICSLLQEIIVPVTALSKLMDGMQNTSRHYEPGKESLRAEYSDLIHAVRIKHLRAISAAGKGLEHAFAALRSREGIHRHDEEKAVPVVAIMNLKTSMAAIVGTKSILLQVWRETHDCEEANYEGQHQALHDMLQLQSLLWSTCCRVLDLVVFADELKAERPSLSAQIQFPHIDYRRPWRVWKSPGRDDSDRYLVGRLRKKDSTHQDPVTWLERSTNPLRSIPHFFASPVAGTALRIMCATMSAAIIGLLHASQAYYIRQHFVWGQYAIGIAFQATAGQGLRKFLMRLVGTVVAVIFAYISWYIVNGHAAGVIVFYGFFLQVPMYILVKYPIYTTLGTVPAFAFTIIVGLELQIHKIGVENLKASGQMAPPMYLVGAVRLAAISVGLCIAWFWTIFPYPISEHNVFVHQLGKCLQTLASYHEATHEAVRTSLKVSKSDLAVQARARKRINTLCSHLYAQCIAQVRTLRIELMLVKYDIPIGGRFPHQQYEDAVSRVASIINRMQLIVFASGSFIDFIKERPPTAWLTRFENVIDETRASTEGITTLLTLLSNSMSTSLPLPPHIKVPGSYFQFSDPDKQIMGIEYASEPGYATLVAILESMKSISADADRLLNGLRGVVGELDFSLYQ